jgi:hypothetical protein
MADKEKVIKEFNDYVHYFKPYCIGDIEDHAMLKDVLELLKEQEAKPPVHIHEEYPEHDWERDENGNIYDFACDWDYHNGPICKRCSYSFCIHCDPDGWNKEPCIIDEYKCPKCGRNISKDTKFCSDCGQAVKWE